jgi:hypothetical protein
MAAVTRPGPADARVPCPLCGGLIHPIAGRCKHCKGDLRALRSARPAAAATLPALSQPAPAPQANGRANDHDRAEGSPRGTNGHHAAAPGPSLVQAVAAAAAAAPIPLATQHGPADAVAILPPRPTGRFTAPAPRASWKSWPVIVIVLAVIAIVTAVVLMVFPPGGPRNPGGAGDSGTNNSLQPAPDRMDTNPAPSTPRLPPSTSPDPWSRRGGGTAPTTPPGAPPDPPDDPPDDPDIDAPDVDDAILNGDPFSRRGLGGLGSRSTSMLAALFKHACARLEECRSTNAQIKQFCDSYPSIPSVMLPRCPAAARCLRQIDEMSCDVSIDDAAGLFELKDKFTDCTDALSC